MFLTVLRIAVLGPLRVLGEDGEPVEIAGARLRALLGRLALSAGRTVPAETLIEDIWGTEPAGTANTLHALVHRLRRALPTAVVESLPMGYRLALPAGQVDAHRFEELAARGRRELAGDHEQAAATLAEALALWQGPAFADVRAPFAETAAVRLAELRVTAAEDRFEAELRLGRHDEVLADLESACAEHPLRERLAALRMRALSAAGRQSAALAAYEDIRGRLADELGVDPAADLRQAHLSVLRGELDQPPARTAPGRLPSQLTSFVGRDNELARLTELMAASRLVTVVGPGGVGKTRLALETAARHRAYREGRLWLVPLAGVEQPSGLTAAVLGALSGSNRAGHAGEPLNRVAELIGGGEAVLLLDNCEHLVAEAALLAQRLLEKRPRLTILATSREPLEVLGETLCRLGPLDLPANGSTTSAAVRLFLDRASAVRPGFTLDESTVDSVLHVVRRLDGLPLALELAAARLRSMDIGQIAQRLDDRFRLLSTGNRAGAPRQRTLRAVIEWSWDLLTEPERVLARRLAFFPATTSAETIEAVCADARLPAADVPYLLGSLVDKSLVERRNGYRMLESIRAFAAEELAADRESVRVRFVGHFAALAAEHEPLARTHAQPATLALLAAEHDNLVFALRAALDHRDATAAVQLLGLLHWYWYTVRYDARTEPFIAELLTLGDLLPADALAAYTALDALIGVHAPATDPDRVRELIEDCAETGALQRYPLLLVVALPMAHRLGLTALAEREMASARARPDPWAAACMSLLAAGIAGERGDWPALTEARSRAARELARTGDRLYTAVALGVLAAAHTVEGEHAAAIAGLERARALATATGTQDEITFLAYLATVRMRAGDLAGAARDLDTADRLVSADGLRHMGLELGRARAELHRRCGDLTGCAQVLARLADLAGQLRVPDLENWLAPARLALHLTTGDTTAARHLLPAAIAGALANDEPAPAAEQLATLLFLESDPTAAATALGLGQALRGTPDQGDPELRELSAALTAHLGEDGYATAYRAGAELPRPEALALLTAHATAVSAV
ncbi:BTAD domain-containing putative transcriptional regulator [Crossiella sp. NPDC003009]